MYKNFFFRTAVLILLLFNGALISAQVTIGANKEPQSFSVLELISGDNKGLRLPQIENDEQRDEIFTNAQGFRDNAAALGLQIFNMCSKCVETWNGTIWISACAPCIMIDGVCWATRNVGEFGEFVKKETDYGMLYQWNRPTAWNTTDEYVTGWDGSMPTGTEWENHHCPIGWRVPTKEEFESLYTYYEWVDNYKGSGVSGGRFGTECNHIFLPAAGYRIPYGGNHYPVGEAGNYYSSTVSNIHEAYFLHFNSDDSVAYLYNFYKSTGRSVRCVKK